MTKEKAIIIFTVAIDVLGLGIIIPVFPVYVESFGLTALNVTMLFSIYSFFSFMSAPFLGALSDKIGRKPVLLVSIFSTSIGWLIFSLARSFPLLIVGRVIDGLAAGNYSTAQSSLSDISKDSKDRASNLGILGMIFGFGFIVGPFIGGVLSRISHATPFYFVAGLAFINVILAYFFLPETNIHIDKSKKIKWNPLKPLYAAFTNKKLKRVYFVWFLFNLIAVAGNSIFALYLAKIFGFNAFISGLFFMMVGIILAVNQGFLMRKFWLEKFNERTLILLMLGFFSIGFLLICIHSLPLFILGTILNAFGQSILTVVMTSEIVGEAHVSERGESLGVLNAISSSATIAAPILAGSLFQSHVLLPYIICSILSFIALLIMRGYKFSKNPQIVDATTVLPEEVVI